MQGRVKPVVVKKTSASSENRLLQSHQATLAAELDILKIESEKLRLREELVAGLCVAGRLATQYGRSCLSGPQRATARAQEALGTIEEQIALLTETGPELLSSSPPSNPLEGWCSEGAAPGSCRGILAKFIRPDHLTGLIHTSMLDGHLLSPSHVALVCLICDPDLTGQVRSAGDQVGTMYEQGQHDQAALTAALEKVGSEDPAIVMEMAVSYMLDLIHWIGLYVLDAYKAIESGAGHEDGFVRVAPAAHLDLVTDRVAPTPQQLVHIIKGSQVFAELQQPLEQQHTAVLSQIHELLQPAAPDKPETGPNPLNQLGDGSHANQLMALGSRLEALRVRFMLTDIGALSYVLGQMTWVQLSRFSSSMLPYPPNVLLWARRLMCRVSLLPRATVPRVPGAEEGSAVLLQVLNARLKAEQQRDKEDRHGSGKTACASITPGNKAASP